LPAFPPANARFWLPKARSFVFEACLSNNIFSKPKSNTMTNAIKLHQMLPRFSGSENYYRHPFLDTNLLLTDGCAYLRETAQSYWLFDIIALQLAKRSDFTIELKQSKNGSWFFTAKDSQKDQIFYTQKIPYSDFPLSEITIWVMSDCFLPGQNEGLGGLKMREPQSGRVAVALLPSEH
jgi:hypothetical protein